jgi:excisionase family DNA binding protein
VVESGALLKRCTPKGYPGFESLPHRCFSALPGATDSLSTAAKRKRVSSRRAPVSGRKQEQLEEILAVMLTKEQLTKTLGVSLRTVTNWIAQRRIRHVKLGRRLIRFKLADVSESSKATRERCAPSRK